MKKLFKEHSIYMLILTCLETILAIGIIIAFVYADSKISNNLFIDAKLLTTLYTQTWWGLILFTLAFISICNITSIVYKKMDYMFMSIMGWILMGVISINFTKSLADVGGALLIFIPIIIINIITYKREKEVLDENITSDKLKKTTKKTVKKTTSKKKK